MARTGGFNVGASPVPDISAAARRYTRTMTGLHVPQHEAYGNVVMPHSRSEEIASAYDRMPSYDRRAVPAYRAMREEVGRQFDFLTKPQSRGGMGVDVEATHEDPYGRNSVHDIVREVRNDVSQGKMKVLSTAATGGHPFFSNDENDMFRAVHDVFGHLGSGRGIDKHGEDAAYLKHSRMFSPAARPAMATETRGQNAALHRHGEFQEQKVGLLPERMLPAQFTRTASPTELSQARQQAMIENRKQGL